MIDNNQVIDPRKQDFWDDEFKQYGIKVLPETAMFYEMETFFPSYVFIDKQTIDKFGVDISEESAELVAAKISFFSKDDKPYFTDEDGKVKWFEIEPMNVYLARMKMLDLMPTSSIRCGVEGYIVPLQENTFYETFEDVNAYLHNLMFWESVISVKQVGPLAQRVFWLSSKLYKMRGEQRDSVVMLTDAGFKDLSVIEDNFKEISKNIVRFRNEYVHGLADAVVKSADAVNETYVQYLTLFLDQMKAKEKNMFETMMRQEKLQRQVEEMQCQIREDATRIGEQREKYADIYEKMVNLIKETKK